MGKFLGDAAVVSKKFVAESIFTLRVKIPQTRFTIEPGEFFEIKTSEEGNVFLRRPFSVSDVFDNEVEFMIDIVGRGTEILSEKKIGDKINILGPLGKGFDYRGDFDTAFIVSGGVGYAPFPLLFKKLRREGKKVVGIAGFATAEKIPRNLAEEFAVATDDGSRGFKGNAVEFARKKLAELRGEKNKIKGFACGPVPMLKAVRQFFQTEKIKAEISIESVMACGVGLCQGCAVERADKKGYWLVCKNGPVFDSSEVVL